jgi:glycine cleavage system H protein
MNFPTDLRYTSSDEWVKVDGKTASIGVTDYAQNQLSDIVYVEIRVEVGDVIKKNSPGATLESVKAAADVNIPVSGKVVAINDGLSSTPEKVNSEPYGAWMIKLELTDPGELNSLMDAGAYQKYCEERSH